MQRDDFGLVITLLAMTAVLFYAGFHFGQQHEKKFWAHAVPEALEKTCLECAGIR